jgi:hypothetical protein
VKHVQENAMPRWEHRAINLADLPPKRDDVALLDEARAKGWELVTITVNRTAFLRRPMTEIADASGATQPARTRSIKGSGA